MAAQRFSFLCFIVFVYNFHSALALAIPTKRADATQLVATLAQTPASTTALSAIDVQTLGIKQAAQMSFAAYCGSISTTKTFKCGPMCDAIPDMQILSVGGDGQATPFTYVGFSPSLNTLVATHGGTDPDQIEQVVQDVAFVPAPLDPRLQALGAPKGALAHAGFQVVWAKTADQMLQGVMDALAGPAKNAAKVLVTGHSLGAATSLLDGLMLKAKLPPTVNLQVVQIALPRVGNSEFADWVNTSLGNSHIHVTNDNDLIPHLPPELLGFKHPAGEVFQKDGNDAATGSAVFCQGQESDDCANGESIFKLSVSPHNGPYLGVTLVSDSCV